jgi:predicted ester cyclase
MQWLIAPFRWFANTSLARSLRFRLIGIVLLASLPTIALLFLTASQQRTEALDAGQEEVVRLARLAASDQGREMDRVQRELTLLSRLPEVRGDDPSDCTSFFQALVADPENAIYVDLRVVNSDGEVVCRSSVTNPLGNYLDLNFIQAALDGTVFTVGPYQVDPLNGRAVISFASPVRDESGQVNRAIVATLDLGGQSTFLMQSTLPEGAVFSVISEDGTLLLQRPVQDDVRVGDSLVGTPWVDDALGAGSAVASSGDGENRRPAQDAADDEGLLVASAPVVVTGTTAVDSRAYVVVELPKASLVRSADEAFRDNLGKLGVAVAVIILAAWVSADLFTARDAETRKSIVAEVYHGYSSGAVQHLDGIIAPDVVDHSALPGQAKGIDGIKQGISAFRTAFPDGEIVPREMIADRDKVIARVSLTGTHIGEFQGVAPTGKRMIADGMETFLFRHGVIAETWSMFGPLVEMKKIEAFQIEPQPPPRKTPFFRRLFGRFRRGNRKDGGA